MGRTAVVLLAGAALACAADPGPPDAGRCRAPRPIADPDAFTLTPEASDPFRRPSAIDAAVSSSVARGRCGPLDVKAEPLGGAPSFSITTLFCAWGTAETRALSGAAEGEPLHLRIWHFSHVKIEAAEAELILAVGERVLWRERVPLPTDGALISADFDAPFAFSPGDRVLWHVANHGQNSWNFLSLEGEADVPCRTD